MSNESSSFSSLSRIPVLTGSTDYARWSLAIKNAAMMADVWEYLDGTETYPGPTDDEKPTAEELVAIKAWKKANSKALGLVGSTCTKELQLHICHRYDFLVRLFGTDSLFSNFFLLLLGLITTPHVLYIHMTYVYPSFLMFNSFTRVYGQEKSLLYYDLLQTSEFYSTDAPSPSFSSTSSTTPPPLYSPPMLINNGPTWRRIPPGCNV